MRVTFCDSWQRPLKSSLRDAPSMLHASFQVSNVLQQLRHEMDASSSPIFLKKVSALAAEYFTMHNVAPLIN
eukprot:1152432-Pelagomonas_calceolata.AAC.3